MLALRGGFHGRTDRPAISIGLDLAIIPKAKRRSETENNLITVEPNNVEELRAAFADADRNNIFFEMTFIEPVMGEGNPGVGVTANFTMR